MSEFSGTEKWIEIILKEVKEASTEEIINRVAIFNTDCSDNIPYVLSQMRMEGKVGYTIKDSENACGKKIVWFLKETVED
ncbi:MAG: hypothetical protein ACTSW1_19380 [Candidatus Hodarchaeales archaeon]